MRGHQNNLYKVKASVFTFFYWILQSSQEHYLSKWLKQALIQEPLIIDLIICFLRFSNLDYMIKCILLLLNQVIPWISIGVLGDDEPTEHGCDLLISFSFIISVGSVVQWLRTVIQVPEVMGSVPTGGKNHCFVFWTFEFAELVSLLLKAKISQKWSRN